MFRLDASKPMRVTGLHHASRTVSDIEKSLAFYRDLLGLTVVADSRAAGPELDIILGLAGTDLRFVELELGNGQLLELLEYRTPNVDADPDPSRARVGAHHIAITLDDIHEAFEALTSAGVRFNCEPKWIGEGFFAGSWTAYCFDPDGLPVELLQRGA
jgi:lactoylglutathione lyase